VIEAVEELVVQELSLRAVFAPHDVDPLDPVP
jgi:hypothetical protein